MKEDDSVTLWQSACQSNFDIDANEVSSIIYYCVYFIYTNRIPFQSSNKQCYARNSHDMHPELMTADGGDSDSMK